MSAEGLDAREEESAGTGTDKNYSIFIIVPCIPVAEPLGREVGDKLVAVIAACKMVGHGTRYKGYVSSGHTRASGSK